MKMRWFKITTKLPAFCVYYGVLMFSAHLLKTVLIYRHYFDLLSTLSDLNPDYYFQMEVAFFHAVWGLFFLVACLLKSARLLLIYYVVFLLLEMQRYTFSLLGWIEIVEKEFVGILGFPFLFILPQIFAIFLLARKIRADR